MSRELDYQRLKCGHRVHDVRLKLKEAWETKAEFEEALESVKELPDYEDLFALVSPLTMLLDSAIRKQVASLRDSGYEPCPENPMRFLYAPLGMYHCPACGCMVMAGMPHTPHDYGCWLGLEDPAALAEMDRELAGHESKE